MKVKSTHTQNSSAHLEQIFVLCASLSVDRLKVGYSDPYRILLSCSMVFLGETSYRKHPINMTPFSPWNACSAAKKYQPLEETGTNIKVAATAGSQRG